jgi:hypothetical protein
MTRDEILSLQANRRTDALIFTNVFKKTAFRSDGNYIFTDQREFLDEGDAYYLGEDQEIIRLPEFTKDMNAAFDVLNKFGNWSVARAWKILDKDWTGYSCWISGGKNLSESALAETVPLAICRAVLLMLYQSKEE